ncbi:MAG: WhiB family transcriptional regulator [Actinobacteria bacterium]|nr:WhiB family transcriptional regulator [Actinomycetota bacterium]
MRFVTPARPGQTWGVITGVTATRWKTRAACAGYPDMIFFPTGDTPSRLIERAKTICSTCAVREPCLEYALSTNQVAGIWGGTTEEERRSLRRKWLSTRRRTA